MSIPLGVRLNNPGNLRPDVHPWRGQSGVSGGFCQFATPAEGALALCKNLLAYSDKDDLITIRQFINRWAPPDDNNDTARYIADVSKQTGVDADAAYDLHSNAQLAMLAKAITCHEQGYNPYSDELFEAAATEALAARSA